MTGYTHETEQRTQHWKGATLGVVVILALAAMATLVAMAPAAVAQGDDCDRTVGDSGDNATIQGAIDAASQDETICVADGTYGEAVVIDKPLTLLADSEAEILVNSTIAASNDDATLVIGADGVTVDGFDVTRTITDPGEAGQASTEAIVVSAVDDASLVGLTVTLSDETGEDDDGNAILIEDGSASIAASSATNDIRVALSAGVHIANADVDIDGLELRNSGIGLYATGANNIEIRSSIVSHNNDDIVNDGSLIDARENYWGSFSGPTAADNPLPLTGADLHGPVDYRPWCADEGCLVLTDGGQEALSGSPFDTIVGLEGEGACSSDAGSGSDDSHARATTDAANPVSAEGPDVLEIFGAAWGCANAFANLEHPDGGSHVTLAGTVLDGSILVGASTVPISDATTSEEDPNPTTSASVEGQCVYGTKEQNDQGSVTLFDDEDPFPFASIEVPEVTGTPTGGVFWDAVFDCFLPALSDASTLDGGSYLKANVSIADGVVTVDYSTVPQSDALTELSGGEL